MAEFLYELIQKIKNDPGWIIYKQNRDNPSRLRRADTFQQEKKKFKEIRDEIMIADETFLFFFDNCDSLEENG